METKYFKPNSLTWWASFAPLMAGVIAALSEAFPALAPVKSVIDALSGGVQPAVLVNMGLVGIGLRGAVAS